MSAARPPLRVLVVGAGAIGQVFGYHFARGGAEVGFVVRPRQVDAARAGLALYPLNRSAAARRRPVHFDDFEVYDDQDVALAARWDVVVLAVSSVAVRTGDWFARLTAGLGDARLLSLLAGADDVPLVHARVPPERVAWGMLAVISFQAPLPGQTLPEPGVSWWFPWGGALGFSGAADVVERVTTTLGRGGMPVRRVAEVAADVAFMGAVLDKTILALECAGWSFAALRADPELLPLARAAMGESWRLAEVTTGRHTPLSLRWIRPWMLRVVLGLAPRLLPLDLERFFHFHYHKVADQTLLLLDAQVARHAERAIPCPATLELSERLRRGRSDREPA